MKLHSRTLSLLLSCAGLMFGCTDDSKGSEMSNEEESTGDGDPGDSDGDPGDGDGDPTTTGDGDGDDGMGSQGMCDPQAQDCPEGEKCTFYRDEANPSGANKCVPIKGDGQAGDPCMALENDTDSCALGFHCWGTEPDNTTGACIEFCDENAMCSTGDPCTITNNGTLPMCLPLCDPLAPDCPNGWACYDDWEFSDNWFCDRDKSGDLGGHGDPCSTINGCNPGLICAVAEVVDSETCATSGSGGCCALVCDINEAIDCPGAAEECVSYYVDAPPPQYANVGICAIPG